MSLLSWKPGCTALLLLIVSAPLALAKTDESPLGRVDFAAGTITPWDGVAANRHHTPAFPGEDAGDALALPEAGPSLPARGSGFSTLFRARDVLDIGLHPARTAAKLYRLDPEGDRQGTACTAQFVGPRHLLTAAHCLVDRTTGTPHPGFEIALRHDGGRDDGILPVISAWAPVSEMEARPAQVAASGDDGPASRCQDMALIEVSEPAGLQLGWLGMSSRADPSQTLHRFSYPHESSSAGLERDLAAGILPENAVAFVRREIESRQLTEPDFSPDNLYYEYGPPDEVQEQALVERNGAVLPGRSGSALINGEAAALAVMSRAVSGANYSCRLTPEIIGAFAAIAGLDDHAD